MADADVPSYEGMKRAIQRVRKNTDDNDALALCDAALEVINSYRNYKLVLRTLGLHADDEGLLLAGLERCIKAHAECDRATALLHKKCT